MYLDKKYLAALSYLKKALHDSPLPKGEEYYDDDSKDRLNLHHYEMYEHLGEAHFIIGKILRDHLKLDREAVHYFKKALAYDAEHIGALFASLSRYLAFFFRVLNVH